MSYLIQSIVAQDPNIFLRLMACATQEGIDNPHVWLRKHLWKFAVQPGWADAYASAKLLRDNWTPESGDAQPPEPGLNEDAITDDMMLSAMQTIKALHPEHIDPEPEPELP